MPSNHKSVGIAQTILYIPAIPVTMYTLAQNWPIRPRISRLPWLTLTILSLMRFIGGIFVILRESRPDNAALAIATVVILNVGLVPLIVSTLGIVGLVLSANTENHALIQKTMMVFRLLFITAFTLFVTGGAISLDGHSTGDHLVQAAYIMFVVAVGTIIGNILHLQFRRSSLAPGSIIYLRGAILVIPFLILRIVYGVLSAFLNPYTWSPLIGSPVAFALMALLPEYFTVATYSYLGLHRFRENATGTRVEIGDVVDQIPTQEQVVDVNSGKV